MSKVNYVEKDGQLIVIGDSALNMANLFKREVRRPLAKGLISPGELDAQEVLSLMIFQVLGEPLSEGEHCYYSVPAEPIDVQDQDVAYHREVFKKIISEHGYTPHPMNEAMAIIYSQCAPEQFSGLAISYGSGMCNIALSYQTMMGLDFSIAREGTDDLHAAKAVGFTASCMLCQGEGRLNLRTRPRARRGGHVPLHLKPHSYSLEKVAQQFRREAGKALPDPVPVVSGGTNQGRWLHGHLQRRVRGHQEEELPHPGLEIRHAADLMTAVAEGLLVLKMQEE